MTTNLFDKPKTATDLLTALLRHAAITDARERSMSRAKLIEEWTGHTWSNSEMTAWSRWQWKEVVK